MITNQSDEQEATPQTIQIGIELENETNDEITLDVQDIKKGIALNRFVSFICYKFDFLSSMANNKTSCYFKRFLFN